MPDDPMVTWLRSALDALQYRAEWAQRFAGARRDSPWSLRGFLDDSQQSDIVCDGVALLGGLDPAANHAALHDPRAVLARVEAELRLVAAYESGDLDHLVMRDVLRLLAHGHRFDVEGYRAEWAPDGVSADA